MAFIESIRALSTNVPQLSTAAQEALDVPAWRLAGGVGLMFPAHQVRAGTVYAKLVKWNLTIKDKNNSYVQYNNFGKLISKVIAHFSASHI